MVNWGKRRRLHSQFAASLLLEAALLLLFGLTGNYLATMPDVLGPVTILLLCFVMGLQNAIITKISGAVIRTTHVTGLSTDIRHRTGQDGVLQPAPPAGPDGEGESRQAENAQPLDQLLFIGASAAPGLKHIGFRRPPSCSPAC